MGSDHRTPTGVFVHGYLTINGQKMSKSRGTFVKARNYLQHLNPEYLRYYFAAKLNNGIEDIDLNFDDFSQRVNSDLVGKVVNIASRCAGFIHKRFAGELADSLMDEALWHEFVVANKAIAAAYEAREYSKAIREIMHLADKANQFIDEQKPWSLAKDESQLAKVQAVCSMGLNLFKVLMVYLKPVLPLMAENVETFLNIPALNWADSHKPLLKHQINEFIPLMTRVDAEKIKAMLAAEAQQ
jgi:methionyl-tRNA synthetase